MIKIFSSKRNLIPCVDRLCLLMTVHVAAPVEVLPWSAPASSCSPSLCKATFGLGVCSFNAIFFIRIMWSVFKTVQINTENSQRTTDIRSWQTYQKNFAFSLMIIPVCHLDVEALLFTCRSFSEICSCNFYKISSYSLLSIFPFILKIFQFSIFQ